MAGKTKKGGRSKKSPTTQQLLFDLFGDEPVTEEKPDRNVISLDSTNQTEFDRYVIGKILADHFGTNGENATEELKSKIFPLWANLLWELKRQPANPSLKSALEDGRPDCECLVVVQESFKVQGNSKTQVVNNLVKAGLRKELAEKIVDAEINFTPRPRIDFDRLQNGEYVDKKFVPATKEQKAIAKKALQLLLSVPGTPPLTDAEKKVLILKVPNVVVHKGFYQRLGEYCREREEVLTVLKVIVPIIAVRNAKIGISDSIQKRTRRLIESAGKILGVNVEVKEELTT